MKRNLLFVVIAVVVLLMACVFAGCGGPTEEEAAALEAAQDIVADENPFWSPGMLETLLEYDGHNSEAVAYAVDNCGVDWNANATAAGKSITKMGVVSNRYDLLSELTELGFTEDQANYAADQLGY